MSMHPSFGKGNSMTKHRNVLTRMEKIEKLKAAGKFEEGKVLGLPKVGNRKPKV